MLKCLNKTLVIIFIFSVPVITLECYIKVLLFAIILGGTVAFTSCGSDKCECTINGVTETYDEDDYDGDLKEACDAADAAAKIVDASGSCSMK